MGFPLSSWWSGLWSLKALWRPLQCLSYAAVLGKPVCMCSPIWRPAADPLRVTHAASSFQMRFHTELRRRQAPSLALGCGLIVINHGYTYSSEQRKFWHSSNFTQWDSNIIIINFLAGIFFGNKKNCLQSSPTCPGCVLGANISLKLPVLTWMGQCTCRKEHVGYCGELHWKRNCTWRLKRDS